MPVVAPSLQLLNRPTFARPAPSRGSSGLAEGVPAHQAAWPHPWDATSCRKAAPLACIQHLCEE
jgi:hypothetical protein